MLLAEFKMLSLEYKNGLNIVVSIFALELLNAFIVWNSEFKHVEQVVSKKSANDQVVGSFLLVSAYSE